MLEQTRAEALKWLAQYAGGSIDERPPHFIFWSNPDARFGDGRPATTTEIAIALETRQTILNGTAAFRLKGLNEWKHRRPGRWVVLAFDKSDVSASDAVGLPRDQTLACPIFSGARAHSSPAVESVTG